MTKEQEAIERLNRIITTKFNNDYSIDSSDKEAIETVLNMLKEKDKIIDLMAEVIYKKINRNGLKKYCTKDKSNCESYKECFECIKQYFERKAEQC